MEHTQSFYNWINVLSVFSFLPRGGTSSPPKGRGTEAAPPNEGGGQPSPPKRCEEGDSGTTQNKEWRPPLHQYHPKGREEKAPQPKIGKQHHTKEGQDRSTITARKVEGKPQHPKERGSTRPFSVGCTQNFEIECSSAQFFVSIKRFYHLPICFSFCTRHVFCSLLFSIHHQGSLHRQLQVTWGNLLTRFFDKVKCFESGASHIFCC